MVPKGGASR